MCGKAIRRIAVSILVFAVLSSLAHANKGLAGFGVVAENESLILYLNEETVEVAVMNKNSGDIWYSNPHDREKKEIHTRGAAKARLNSQVVITYYVANRQYEMDSYNDCIIYGQHEIKPIPNGVRIHYNLGQMWQPEDYMPVIISEERFNQLILANIDKEKERAFLRDQYALFSLEKGYDSGDEISIHGVDLDQLLGDYGLKIDEPKFKTSDRRRLLQEYLVKVRDAKKYDGIGQVKTEEISSLFGTPTLMLKWNVKGWDKDTIVELARSAGYTPEDIAYDHMMYNITPPYPSVRNFDVAVEYLIDGPDLVVRVPKDSLTYPHKVFDPSVDKEVSYPMTSISLLSYFGAADGDAEGYIVVPDGSGALIYLNNGKEGALPYKRPVYGLDYAVMPIREYSSMLKEQIHLPVYGLKSGDKAFVAVIEEGDAMASIEAVVAGMRDSYNRVWATFDMLPSARVHLQERGARMDLRQLSINMYQARFTDSDIVIRYYFLSGDEASYSGMARSYQDYVVTKHNMHRIKDAAGLPLILEILGSMDKTKPVLGLPINVVEPLTTYQQANRILDDLVSQGIDDIKVRYLGWMKGGINHIFPTKVQLESKVGDERQLRELKEYLQRQEIELFPDVAFLRVKRNGLLDGFTVHRDSPRSLNRKNAFINQYNLASMQPISTKRIQLLSPGRLGGVAESFISDYGKLGISGLSLADLGKYLYSDFRLDPTLVVDRQQSIGIITGQAELMRDMGLDLLVEAGNAYMFPYAKYIVDAPMYSRGAELIDNSIPFYQMILSGYVGYCGSPANLADRGGQPYLLKALETGSLPYFAVAASPSSAVKHTDFNHLYSISYEDLRQHILEVYQQADEVIGDIWYKRIVEHEILAQDVYRTEYEDGTNVFVNYSAEDVMVGDLVIAAESYLVQRRW